MRLLLLAVLAAGCLLVAFGCGLWSLPLGLVVAGGEAVAAAAAGLYLTAREGSTA